VCNIVCDALRWVLWGWEMRVGVGVGYWPVGFSILDVCVCVILCMRVFSKIDVA
jgi:hypothetical protein